MMSEIHYIDLKAMRHGRNHTPCITQNYTKKGFKVNRMCIEKYLMPFGKYQGTFVADVAMENPDYLTWLREKQIDEQLKEAIDYHLEWSVAER